MSGTDTLERRQLEAIAGGAHHDPHSVLGPHLDDDGLSVRVLRPFATSVQVEHAGTITDLRHQHAGIWAGRLGVDEVVDYRLLVTYDDGIAHRMDDPYRYLPTLGQVDLHLIGEGRHENLWRVLGAHVRSYDAADGTVTGTSFAVWAPNARGVRVLGDFNGWNGTLHPMRSLGSSGVWELFLPDVGDGALYKFEVLGADSQWREKADPMAFATQAPPATASRVYTSDYTWGDADWLTERARGGWHERPMSVYEVHLGSWRQGRSYRDLATELVDYVTRMGFTHVEFLPVAEHPFGGSWGYQVSGYYAPTARFGDPDDLRALIDALHQAGIGVIVDWVPAHFPKDTFSLGRFDGTPLYEHPDPRRGEHTEWGTYIFDFGRREVRNFLVANALFWLEQFHVDALRVDAVASMLYLDYSREDGQWAPNQYGGRENLEAVAFLQETNATCFKRVPGITIIAEESTSWPGVTRPTHLGGLGFGFKWNMGWMHDTLSYIGHDPIHRQYHHHEMTFSMVYAYSENFVLPLSHDESCTARARCCARSPATGGASWPHCAPISPSCGPTPASSCCSWAGSWARKRSGARSASSTGGCWTIPTPPGSTGWSATSTAPTAPSRRCGRWTPTRRASSGSTPTTRAATSTASCGAVRDGSTVACVSNFSASAYESYRLGLPVTGGWRELVNSDAEHYGGSGVGNLGRVGRRSRRVARLARLRHAAGSTAGHRVAAPRARGVTEQNPPELVDGDLILRPRTGGSDGVVFDVALGEQLLGQVGVQRIGDDVGLLDLQLDDAALLEVGAPTVRLLVTHAFAASGLHRLEAHVDPADVRVLRLLSRAGLRREGVLRGRRSRGGQRSDQGADGPPCRRPGQRQPRRLHRDPQRGPAPQAGDLAASGARPGRSGAAVRADLQERVGPTRWGDRADGVPGRRVGARATRGARHARGRGRAAHRQLVAAVARVG
jgi:1,4-alpha-glucan branching enzyme